MNNYIKPYKNGIALVIRAIPNSSINKISIDNNRIKVYITASAREGKANKQIIKSLSSYLKLRKKQIEIIKGKKSKNKEIYISDLSEKDIIFKLNEVI